MKIEIILVGILTFIPVSIALTIGLCLAAAGFHLFLTIKERITHQQEDLSECFAF